MSVIRSLTKIDALDDIGGRPGEDNPKFRFDLLALKLNMKNLKFISNSAADTQKLGQQLGELAQPGDIYLLCGNLGAGKTCLTQGIVWGLDSREYALSPTFVLMREIQGRLPLYHIDLYRLDQTAEIADLGLDDYLYGQGVCVIEWADKGLSVLPPEHLLIQIEYRGDNRRELQLTARGAHYEKMLNTLKKKLRQV